MSGASTQPKVIEQPEIPMATVVTDDIDDQDIPVAQRFIDWDELAKRVMQHLDTAVIIVMKGHEMANAQEVKADLIHAFGWLFGSKTMEESAAQRRNDANEMRKTSIKLGVAYLTLALGWEMLRLTYQQGLLHQAYNSISTSLSAITSTVTNSVRSWFNWGKGKVESAVLANKQTNNSDVKTPSAPPLDVDNGQGAFLPGYKKKLAYDANSKIDVQPSAPPAPTSDLFTYNVRPSDTLTPPPMGM